MATWVEDILQALKDLGGKGTLREIYDQVALIRKEPMPITWESSIRERIEAHSEDSKNFRGKHYFTKLGKGVWGLSNFEFSNDLGQINVKEIDTTIMENNSPITENSLFTGKELLKFSLEDSLESISHLFQTIKEYREYADKDNVAGWFQYIHDIFSILGLNTIKISERLFKLQDLGVDQDPKALVCIVGPYENFEYIAYDVTWESYLLYAAKYHRLDWVILTNGLQFKVINYSEDQEEQKFFQMEFDEAIQKGNIDSFFTFYKILNVINHFSEKKLPSELSSSHVKGEGTKRVLVERHFTRKEFWTQFIAKAKTKTNLFNKKSPGFENYFAIGSGKRGISYSCNVNHDNCRIEIYIDNGKYEWNKALFDYFYQHKLEIENALGVSLVWDRLEGNRASVIRFPINGKSLDNKAEWPELQNSLIDNTIKIETVFRPLIQDYPG